MATAKLLLDTHSFLWWVLDPKQLSKKAILAIEAPSNEIYLSGVSVWEMAIKVSLGKLGLPLSVEAFVTRYCHENRFKMLPIDFRHVARIEHLPKHHGDPFDRLLISQAIEEGLTIISKDQLFKRYAISRLW